MAKSNREADHDQQVDDTEQPLIGHLLELRQRLLHVVIFIVVLFVPLYYFANELYLFVASPLMAYLPASSGMIATEVAAPFLTPLKLALTSAFIVAMPYVLYQLWSFIAPGLYRREKRFAIPVMISSIILFYCGVGFAYYAVMPLIFQFTTAVVPEGVAVMTDISRYLEFILKLFFAFGFTFEIPIATMLLVRSGATTVDSLKHKRPYFLVGCFIAGMLLTPPDVVSQILLAIPMYLLYEVGLFLSAWIAPKPSAQD